MTKAELAHRCYQLVKALEFCRDRLDSWQTVMSECDGLSGWHLNGEVAKWNEIDEPMMTDAGIEVANRVLSGGNFALETLVVEGRA